MSENQAGVRRRPAGHKSATRMSAETPQTSEEHLRRKEERRRTDKPRNSNLRVLNSQEQVKKQFNLRGPLMEHLCIESFKKIKLSRVLAQACSFLRTCNAQHPLVSGLARVANPITEMSCYNVETIFEDPTDYPTAIQEAVNDLYGREYYLNGLCVAPRTRRRKNGPRFRYCSNSLKDSERENSAKEFTPYLVFSC